MHKGFSLKDILCGLVQMARPLEWSKSLLAMSIGLLMAHHVFGVTIDMFLFAEGFFAVALMWSGLYALNDYTDRRIDALHEVKRQRPIPRGVVKPVLALSFSFVLLVASLLLALNIANPLFSSCLVIMLVNQLLYTIKPFRFKERKVLDIISGSFVNPVFRYLAGLLLFVSTAAFFSSGFPVLPVIAVLGFQVGSYSLNRVSSKEHDQKLNMRSTVTALHEDKIKKGSKYLLRIAGLACLLILINGFTLKTPWLGYLPFYYLISLAPLIVAGPFLIRLMRDPKRAMEPQTQSRVYYSIHLITIIVTLLLIFLMLLFR